MATLSRPTITDDSGSNTDGTIADAAWVDDFCDRIDALAVDVLAEAITQVAIVQTTTSTGTQSDFALTAGARLLRCNNATELTFTGFAAGTDGQRVTVVSVGAGQVNFSHQVTSTAANRLINFATVGLTPLAAGSGVATYQYDGTTARWRLIAHEQGAWITPTFAAGDYTGPTWTVGSGDVTTQAYRLTGRTLEVSWYLATTTVSGTPSALLIGNGAWGGFTSAKTAIQLGLGNNAGGGNELCFAQVTAGGTSIGVYQVDGGTWSNATDTTNLFGSVVFEVQ